MNYFAQLAMSADLSEVVALYHAAGLSLTRDLQTLNHASRISAKPSAVSYLAQNIAFDGRSSGAGAHHAHHRRRPGGPRK